MTAADWKHVRIEAGQLVCPEHGVVSRPWRQIVPACPDCHRALHVAVHEGGQVVTQEIRPERCGGPGRHPLAPGKVLIGSASCTCSASGIHRSWTCTECGDVQHWPPHSVVDAAPFFGPGSGG